MCLTVSENQRSAHLYALRTYLFSRMVKWDCHVTLIEQFACEVTGYLFFRRIRKRICDLRLYEFFTAGKTQNPKTDFWLYKVRAQQEPAPGAQHILYGRFENHGGEFFKHQREPIGSWHESLPAAPCSPPSQGNCGAFARLVSPGCRVLRNLAGHQPTPGAPQEIFWRFAVISKQIVRACINCRFSEQAAFD